jgi:entry exclusion lipoprotein TrbK
MKKISVLVLVLSGLIAGCSSEKPSEKRLTCADSPKGRPRAEQMAIADACFLRGTFKKSPHREW